jgi:hypothetical protein
MHYFETITNTAIFGRERLAGSKDINEIDELPAGSKWSTAQLFAARVLIRTARPDSRCNHILPALREYFDETAHNQPRIRELLEGPGQPGYKLTETELVHLYGESLGPFWAALARFGSIEQTEPEGEAMGMDVDEQGDDSLKRPHSSESELSSQAPTQSKRVRMEPKRLDFVDSSSMRVGSSSPTAPSASQGSSVGFVGQNDHASVDLPEQATVQIVSSFIRHLLRSCPPQDDTQQHRPQCLVELSGIWREHDGVMWNGEHIRATADGELALHTLSLEGYYKLAKQRPALLEAKTILHHQGWRTGNHR